MKKVCRDCGAANTEQAVNCENCGSSFDAVSVTIEEPIKAVETETAPQEQTQKLEHKNCPECNAENTLQAKFCSECGHSFVVSAPVSSGKHNAHGSAQNNKKHKHQQAQHKPAAAQNKEAMNTTQIVYIFVAILVAGLAVLYFSGVFSSPEEKTTANAPANSGPETPGVDLSAINAINSLEATVKANPSDTASVINLAHMLNDAGFYERAIPYYKQYLKVNPKSAETIIDMGVCYYGMKNYDTADSLMKSALKINPKHQIGMLNLGVINMARNNMEEAKKWLEKTIAVDPASENASRAKQLLESHNH